MGQEGSGGGRKRRNGGVKTGREGGWVVGRWEGKQETTKKKEERRVVRTNTIVTLAENPFYFRVY